MPGIATEARSWILEGLELEAVFRESQQFPEFQQARTIRRHDMRHSASVPYVPVQPDSAVERVDHPVATTGKLQREKFRG